MRSILPAVALVAPLLAACAAPPPPAAAPSGLVGTSWRLTEFVGEAVARPVTLNFEGERARGEGPCNSYFGAWRLDGAAVEIGPVAATRRACRDLSFEQGYFGALTDVASADIGAETLALRGADGAVLMRFARN
jgi:heat shock protein HslJ